MSPLWRTRVGPRVLGGILLAALMLAGCRPSETYRPSSPGYRAGQQQVRVRMGSAAVPTALADDAQIRAVVVPEPQGSRAWDELPPNAADATTWPAYRDGDTLVADVTGVDEGRYAVWLGWGDRHSDGYTTIVIDRTGPTLRLDPPVRVSAGVYRISGHVTDNLHPAGGIHLEAIGLDGDWHVDGPDGSFAVTVRVFDPAGRITATDDVGNQTVSAPMPLETFPGAP